MYDNSPSSHCSCFEVGLGPSNGGGAHTHPHHEFILCTAGRGVQNLAGQEFEMVPKALFFLPANAEHAARGVGPKRCKCLVLYLGELGWVGDEQKGDREVSWLLAEFAHMATDGRPGIALDAATAVAAETILNAIVDSLARSATGFRMEVKSLLLQFFSLLLTNPHLRDCFRRIETKNRIDEGGAGRFGLLMKYLSENYWEKVSVEKAMRLTHMSRSHFHATFRQQFGCTLGAYVQKLRLESASEALTSGDASPAAVALDCGFPSLSNFYRCFKRAYGQTPGAFQRAGHTG